MQRKSKDNDTLCISTANCDVGLENLWTTMMIFLKNPIPLKNRDQDKKLGGQEFKNDYPEERVLSILEEIEMNFFQDYKVSLTLLYEFIEAIHLRELEWCYIVIIPW